MSDNQLGAIDLLRRELATKEADVQNLRHIIEQLEGRVSIVPTSVQASSQEYANMGVTEAIRHFMKEAGKPASTRDIVDALLDRGLRSRSKNLVASVYATLTNNEKEFGRKDGNWFLKEVGK